VDLSEACLIGASLVGANLTGAALMWAALTRADLSGANLSGANLNLARLGEAHLVGANLNKANLLLANLLGADLSGADLSGANLADAYLGRADLSEAELSGANLRRADLGRANLNKANLCETDLSGAILYFTSFGFTNLRDAIGLDLCQHRGLSFVDYYTLSVSGSLPRTFLRGCGLPGKLIEYAPSLLTEAAHFPSCFIGHVAEDGEFAELLQEDLQKHGIPCWCALEDLTIGDKLQEGIQDSIRLHDKLLLLLSASSLNNPWIKREVRVARERELREGKLVVFPIRLDNVIMSEPWAADLRRTRHIADFSRWEDPRAYDSALKQLLRELKAGGAAGSILTH
jgi:hypothetical protein